MIMMSHEIEKKMIEVIKDQMEILDLKNMITKMQNALEGINSESEPTKESVNLTIDQ